ncbi:hypothetical protein BO70DRAFT_417851 [Aspergillus heteromorphus CBS 117.55]|uniref:Uncharacterized protein n=1 Tax=Aspergillus heteromorphus CBS 117.55 TaxID=1448321 RepID=A0A317WR91_9EURO|nr:uncharacterized protein BO70DRAFT_417851 [Aspergillus heteromorphus CBS 117.55]PWY88963.1 hypothetical protein BO70DRAFT_417851 [Aspergillus heteromorphus CBS 117.55]
MRVFPILLYWFCCVIVGKAADTAGLYEALFYFYAYRIEYAAFSSAEDRYIGTHCVSASGGLCTFNEFIESWSNKNYLPKVYLAAGDTVYPAVEGADTVFAEMEWPGSYIISKLYRDATKWNYEHMLAAITNRVQAAKGVMTVDSVLLQNSRRALEIAQINRWNENLPRTQESFQERFEGVTLYDKTVKVADGTVKVIDWDKTATEQSKVSKSSSKDLLKRYKKWAGSNKASEYLHHQNIMRNVVTYRNVLGCGSSCSAVAQKFKDLS